MAQIEDWKLARLLELGARTGIHRVYPDQIAERLGLTDTYVIRTLRRHGIEPQFRPKWSATKWLERQYAKDKAEGRKTGKRPPNFSRLP